MNDIANTARADLQAAEAYADKLVHGEVATLAPIASAADVWVLCDVGIIAMAFVAGHYL